MSVQTMAAVWKGSRHSGSALLMMLAIADFADDAGKAYPAVATLAKKTRMKPRNANYLLRDLQASGELVVKLGAGPHATNLYRIVIERLGLHSIAPLHPVAPLQGTAPLHPSAGGAAPQCALPLQPSADKPSRNHQEPKRAVHTALPQGFAVSERVRAWARSKGFEPYLEAHLEHFIGSVRATGKKYVDWDQAFENCIRGDYGDVRAKLQKTYRANGSADIYAGSTV